MQRNKSNKLNSEIELLSTDKKSLGSSLSSVLEKFQVKNYFSDFDFLKSKGVAASNLLHTLVMLPFLGVLSIHEMLTLPTLDKDVEARKDAYYGIKNNEFINWRKLLMALAKRFLFLTKRIEKREQAQASDQLTNVKKTTALIFDDSTLSKTGKVIEKTGLVHDHTTGLYVLGYKLLVCGYWNGDSFIPVDFSLHREKGNKQSKLIKACSTAHKEFVAISKKREIAKTKLEKQEQRVIRASKALDAKATKINQMLNNRAQQALEKAQNVAVSLEKEYTEKQKHKAKCSKELRRFYRQGTLYGLKENQRKVQFKKSVKTDSPAFKRRKEADRSKMQVMLEMLGRTLKNGIVPDYVLVDSWFFCKNLLNKLAQVRHARVKLISMMKLANQKVTLCENGKQTSVKALLTMKKRKARRCRKHKAKYIKVNCEYAGHRLNLFYVTMGRSDKWHLIATTDLEIGFVKLIETYQIRWGIEVFFKEAKQHLNLEGCQSRDFDAQIANASISMIQYMLLSYYKRINYQQSIGGLFKSIQKEIIEIDLLTRLLKILNELMELLCECVGIDIFTFQKEVLRNDAILTKLAQLHPMQTHT